ncbi:MAG TPA: ABC transporter permease [Opitutaceae bacterium]|nr:ABC transporter permease [Opitutaceae bacterium]
MFTDLRIAVRRLLKSSGFTGVAVAIVAIGIGAATAMFSIVNTLVLEPVALPEPDRLVAVYETHLERNLPDFAVSLPNYMDWRDRNQSFASIAALNWRAMNLTGDGGEPELIQVKRVSANFLPTLGIPVLHGRNFSEAEAQPGGGDNVAIVTDAFWRRRLGAASDALGRSLTLDGTIYTVIGITAPGSPLPVEIEIAIPLIPGADENDNQRLNHELAVFGRLKPGVSIEQADAELKALAAQTWQENPNLDHGWSTQLMPFAREIVGDSVRRGVFVLLGAVGVLLLIACANLSNVMLVRATGRAHELAIRTALGASRWRVVRQLLNESLLVTAAGGALGVLLAAWAIDAMHSLSLPRAHEISLDSRVLAAACAMTLLTGLLAGTGPALAASQSRPQEALKGRAPLAGHRSRFRDSLVVAQIALSLTLLVGAVLLMRSFWRLLHVDPGFNTGHVLTLALRPTDNSVAFYDELHRRTSAFPGVEAVGSISRLPLTDGSTSNNVSAIGPSALAPGESVQASWRLIHGDYFEAMQIPLLRGQTFRGIAPREARSSMVISASLARTLWGDDDPIGRKIARAGGEFTVVGVVGDVRSQQLGAAPQPAFYMSVHRFIYGPQSLVVRMAAPQSGEDNGAAGVAPLFTAIRTAIKEVDPAVPIFRVRTMEEVRARSLEQERFIIALLGGFAGIAWFLAALGTYGVIAYSVQQRTRELGIRIAVGAQRSDILQLVLGQGARLAALGVVLGIAGSLAATRLLSSQLYETSYADPVSYLIATTGLALAALLATLLPARRAARVDPMVALRAE